MSDATSVGASGVPGGNGHRGRASALATEGPPEWPSDSPLFWTIYGLAWLPFAAGYLLIAVSGGCTTVADGGTWAATFTLPGALLGVGAVRMTRYRDWPPDHPIRFGLLHLACALGYTALWLAGAGLVLGLFGVAQGRSFQIVGLDSGLFRWHIVAGLLLYGAIVAVTYLARTGRRLQGERERAVRREALRVRAEIESIQSRLNPHFLFNALHSVLSLIRRAPERAERALEQLGDLLRYAVDGGEEAGAEQVSLRTELEMVRTYLELEKLRFGDRLQVTEAVDDEALDVQLPPLTIQPLVENAVQHGIGESPDGGVLSLRAALENGGGGPRVVVVVGDDGPGADPDEIRASDGMGIQLVRQRLELMYGEAAGLEIETRAREGFEARIRIPVRQGADARDTAEVRA